MSINISFIPQVQNIQYPQNNVTFCGRKNSDSFSSGFKARKNRIISDLYHKKFINREDIKRLKGCQTEELFNDLLSGYVETITEMIEYTHIDNNRDVLLNIVNRNGVSKLTEEQTFRKSTIKSYDRLTELYKSVMEPDRDKDILLIKDVLKQKYNVEEMYFNNDVKAAQNWLNTAKIVSEYGLEMPKCIFSCPYVFSEGTNAITSKGSMVVINPDKAHYTGIESTNHPLHAYVHETVHCNQLSLIAFNLMNIPEKYKQTADNVSPYAKDNFMHEIHAELKTKQILSKLSPDERQLLDFIED